jgi:hypothetical protein
MADIPTARPDDPRYVALPLTDAPDMDARLAFVISGWGVLYPLERLKLATAQGKQDLIKSHATFFGNNETHLEATPALAIERGEKLYLPPALVFQGTRDEWTTVDQAQQLATSTGALAGSWICCCWRANTTPSSTNTHSPPIR